jgi:NAD(P)H-dependent flavin oxidoreductase YrpB (nitropropane dioxygenase family)
MGLPFWVGGGCGDPETLKEMRVLGAKGVQVGTLFAFCEESGLANDIKGMICQKAAKGKGEVYTDPLCSPTRFPFKILQLEGSISEKEIYEARPRVCDLGYLQELYRREDGTLGQRCASEPVEDYLNKGGCREDTEGRKCLCNGLMANIAHPQIRKTGYREKPLVTSGNAVNEIARFLTNENTAYTALDVVRYLLSGE